MKTHSGDEWGVQGLVYKERRGRAGGLGCRPLSLIDSGEVWVIKGRLIPLWSSHCISRHNNGVLWLNTGGALWRDLLRAEEARAEGHEL